MDLPLRRKDVWIVGSVCLISSPLLWRVLRSGMTQGGHRQAPAPEDTQVVLPLPTKTDPFYSCLNVFNQGAVLARGAGVHAPDCPLSDNRGRCYISKFPTLAPPFGNLKAAIPGAC